jgi:hypothetical protein
MRRFVVLTALAMAAAGCTGEGAGAAGPVSPISPAPDGAEGSPTAPDPTRVEIYTAAFRSLADTERWFDPVLLDDRICPETANPAGRGSCEERFTEAEQAEILAGLADLPNARFVDDADRIQHRIFSGGLSGAGLLTVGAIEGNDERVTVAGRSYCGGLCAHWITLVIRHRPDGWTVTGTTGPIGIA